MERKRTAGQKAEKAADGSVCGSATRGEVPQVGVSGSVCGAGVGGGFGGWWVSDGGLDH